jgi:hypothetical protein
MYALRSPICGLYLFYLPVYDRHGIAVICWISVLNGMKGKLNLRKLLRLNQYPIEQKTDDQSIALINKTRK